MRAPGNTGPQPGEEKEAGKPQPQLGGKDAGYSQPQLGEEKNARKSHPQSKGKDADFKGWYSRGYLPHFDSAEVIQFITFRLADSLSQAKLDELEKELFLLPKTQQDVERRKKIEKWPDSGIGCCALKHPEVARITQETLLLFDGERYRLLAWCIMPNHVHVLLEPMIPLGKILQSWKSFTGRWALEKNVELGLDIPGKTLWMREYWDRYIRDENHLHAVVDYIHENPVKAGFCTKADEWTWSSACMKIFI